MFGMNLSGSSGSGAEDRCSLSGGKVREAEDKLREAEDKLILSLCKEKDFGIVGASDEELIQKFREVYKDHLELLTKAILGDNKALRHLRWVLGLKVVT
jgi:hypothetical protein